MQRPISIHGYAYGYNSPPNLADPSGLDPWWCASRPNPLACYYAVMGIYFPQASAVPNAMTPTGPTGTPTPGWPTATPTPTPTPYPTATPGLPILSATTPGDNDANLGRWVILTYTKNPVYYVEDGVSQSCNLVPTNGPGLSGGIASEVVNRVEFTRLWDALGCAYRTYFTHPFPQACDGLYTTQTGFSGYGNIGMENVPLLGDFGVGGYYQRNTLADGAVEYEEGLVLSGGPGSLTYNATGPNHAFEFSLNKFPGTLEINPSCSVEASTTIGAESGSVRVAVPYSLFAPYASNADTFAFQYLRPYVPQGYHYDPSATRYVTAPFSGQLQGYLANPSMRGVLNPFPDWMDGVAGPAWGRHRNVPWICGGTGEW